MRKHLHAAEQGRVAQGHSFAEEIGVVYTAFGQLGGHALSAALGDQGDLGALIGQTNAVRGVGGQGQTNVIGSGGIPGENDQLIFGTVGLGKKPRS